MRQDRIAILMSTYNGERYLRKQIESIQNQTNHDWHLFIRDDGSNDSTISIISKLVSEDNRITFINQNSIHNLGVVKSFMSLLKVVDADFYMFADQDDYWKSNKIEKAIIMMKKQNYLNIPICLHTELEIVNDKLQSIKLMKRGRVWSDFQHFLFGNCVTGCTVMINQKLKEKLRLNILNVNRIVMHDWWFADVASAFGKVVYDSTPTILYRQHIGNIVGGKDSQSPLQLIHRFFNPQEELRNFLLMERMVTEFQRIYGGELSGDDARYLSAYADLHQNSSFSNNLKLAIKLPPIRSHMRGRLLLDYLMVCHSRKFIFDENNIN